MKIIKHKWNTIKFREQQCSKCGCLKVRRDSRFDIYSNPILIYSSYFFYRNGQQLANLPECKSTYHNDKI
jgi:hypothetical protein